MRSSQSSEDVVKVTEDLSECRNRLDAGIEENRRNRQVIQDINDQLQRLRQRAHADSLESFSVTNPTFVASHPDTIVPPFSTNHPYTSMPSLTIDIPLHSTATIHSSYTQNGGIAYRNNRHKSLGSSTISNRLRSISPPVEHARHRSSPRVLSHYTGGALQEDENLEELFGRLKEELFKNNTLEEVNEMLREENDAALAANEHLRVDATNLSRQLQLLQQQQHAESMRFRAENTRYRNQVEVQHRKLIDLWKEFTAVKRQLHEVRTSTANDLDRQLTEFTRCAALMKKAIRHAEQKNVNLKEEMRREKDDVLDETLRQLNKTTEDFMKAEEKGNERQRELRKAEDEVRKLKEQNEQYVEILEQLSKMTYELAGNRARSQSPRILRFSPKENPMEVARKMRKLLTTKNGEIDESKEVARLAEKERDKVKKELEKEEKMRREDREADRKRANLYSQREHDLKKLEEDLRKACEKIRNLEELRSSQEKLVQSVQNSLADAHRQHKEFIEELMGRHREELRERQDSYDEMLKNREVEEKNRLERERIERERIRKENEELKERMRGMKGNVAAIRTDIDDKIMRMEMVENERDEMRRKLDEERELADRRELEIGELRRKLDEMQEKDVELRRELAEAQSTVSAMESDMKQHQEHAMDAKNQVNSVEEQLENLSMELESKSEELRVLKETIVEKEMVIKSINTSSHQISATYEEANGEIEILKGELKRLHEQMNERTRQISETNGKFDELVRRNEMLGEDVVGWKEKCDALMVEIEEMNRRRIRKEQEELELRSLIEDLRANFDKLTNDLKQRNITIDSMKEEADGLKERLVKSEKERKEEMIRLEEMEKKNEIEIREEYEERIKLAIKDRNDGEKFCKEIESRLNELRKIHELLIEEHDQLKIDHLHTNEEMEKLKEKLRREIEKANEQNEMDRVEWNNEKTKIEFMKNERIQELQDRIVVLEKAVKEKEDLESELRKNLGESEGKIEKLEEIVKMLEGANEEKEEKLKSERQELDAERLKLMEQKEEAVLMATKYMTTIDQQNRKISNSESEIEKLNVLIQDRDSSIRALESNTMELIGKLEEFGKENDQMKDEIAVMRKQNEELKHGKEELAEKWGEEKRRIQEMSDEMREMNKNLHNIRMKNVNLEEKKSELEQNSTVLNNKLRQLEIQLMDKSAKNEVSGDLLRKMEQDAQSMLKQAQNEHHKMTDLEKTRRALQDENQKLAHDLATVKAAFEAKRESSKSAISDILVQYRKAEERANDGALENQKLRSELQNVNMKLERVDLKLKESENKLKDGQKRYDELQSRLNNIQRSAVESIKNPISVNNRNRSLYIDIPRAASSIGLNDSGDAMLRRSPSVRFADSTQNVEETVEAMDVSSSVGITLRFLKERIEHLEIDKAELTDLVDKLKDDMRLKNEQLNERQIEIGRVERQLIHITEEKNTVESRMTSQRQMYLTNEESSRARENELRSMKARISTLEIHLREKESKITHLKREIDVLHGQLHDAIEAREKVSSHIGGQESKYREIEENLEKAIRERDAATGKSRRAAVEIENLNRKIEQLERDREQLMREVTEERRINEKNRVILEELRTNEKNWKNAVLNARKSAEEVERNVSDQRRWEESYQEMSNRNITLTKECDRLRIEMREHLNKMNNMNLKNVESDKKNEELSSRLLILQNNVSALKKFEEDWKILEAEMRAELKQLRKEKLSQAAEVEDLKRRGLRSETEKKEIEGIRIRLEREICALKRHVDALEEEKGRTEKAVRETMHERRAIDKSLASMERENQQLYRNCAQLQAQIQQLEREAGNRSVAKLAKDHSILEARIATLIEEKRQLQMLVDQKDANHSHKRKLLESQIQMLREQLESERKKRGAIRNGASTRRATQHNSEFRKTIEHRSVSCERMVIEQHYKHLVYHEDPRGNSRTLVAMNQPRQTPPISPMSHSDSYTSGTLIM